MELKKLATDVVAGVVAHWTTALLVTVVTLGLPLWGRVTDQWSWPVAAAVGVVMLAATLTIFRRTTRGRVYETTAESSPEQYPASNTDVAMCGSSRVGFDVLDDTVEQPPRDRDRRQCDKLRASVSEQITAFQFKFSSLPP